MRVARFAAAAIFFLNGFGFASWVVRIPAVQERLALSEGPLGIALLGAAVGLLISTPLAGWLVARLGSRPVVGVTSLLVSLVLLPLALAPNLPLLVLANVAGGAFAGALDVSMNAQAVAVEKGYARPIMSSFHAAFSFGGLAGAASGGLVASLGVGVLPISPASPPCQPPRRSWHTGRCCRRAPTRAGKETEVRHSPDRRGGSWGSG